MYHCEKHRTLNTIRKIIIVAGETSLMKFRSMILNPENPNPREVSKSNFSIYVSVLKLAYFRILPPIVKKTRKTHVEMSILRKICKANPESFRGNHRETIWR
jgi:hypothetical protein